MNSTAQPATTGRPLVVHEGHYYCDRCAAEYAVVTDGLRAIVDGDPDRDMEWSRSTVYAGTIEAACGYVNRINDEPCDGHVQVDLTTPGWTAEAEYVELLVKHGQPVID